VTFGTPLCSSKNGISIRDRQRNVRRSLDIWNSFVFF